MALNVGCGSSGKTCGRDSNGVRTRLARGSWPLPVHFRVAGGLNPLKKLRGEEVECLGRGHQARWQRKSNG